MSRKEFMEELAMRLRELPAEEREDALRYYESYFDEAGPEQEQLVLDELGSAEKVASQIIQDFYGEKKTKEQTAESHSSGIYVTNKGLSGGSLVVAILIAILTFPIWISILATAFGLLMGFFGATIGITVGFGVGGVGCLIGGVAAFVIGVIKSVAVPVVGAGMIAMGLIIFGVGCLMIAVAGGMVKLAIWLVKSVVSLLSRVFHGKRGNAV